MLCPSIETGKCIGVAGAIIAAVNYVMVLYVCMSDGKSDVYIYGESVLRLFT